MPAPRPSPAARLSLGFAGLAQTPERHLSVDGMTKAGPNLSHWPGNRTPAAFKADLSTGICMNFARASHDQQARFLAGAGTVLNDHYDTDGFGSLLAILRPDVVEPREELLLAAAATGDFGTYHSWRGFAVDRIVANIDADSSPVAHEFRGLDGPDKSLARYRWLIDHAADVLDRPQTFAALYEDELAAVTGAIEAGLRGAIQRRIHDQIGLSVVTATGDTHRMTLNTLASAFRVLHVDVGGDNARFRYHDRTESWFELLTIRPLPRRDLRPLALRLDELEPPHDGARWCADAPTEPIPELYFGKPSTQEYGQVTRLMLPSRLPPELVERELVAFFAAPEVS